MCFFDEEVLWNIPGKKYLIFLLPANECSLDLLPATAMSIPTYLIFFLGKHLKNLTVSSYYSHEKLPVLSMLTRGNISQTLES